MRFDRSKILIDLKTFLPEVLILIFLCIVAYLLSEQPKIELQTKKVETQPPASLEVTRHSVKSEKIMERNLFSIDGKYESVFPSIPEEPYRLIAIIIGSEKRALLKDFTGRTFTANLKDSLFDGFTLTEIKENSIILKRGANTKELFIFKQRQKQ